MDAIVFDGDFHAMEDYSVSQSKPNIMFENNSMIQAKTHTEASMMTTKECHSTDTYKYVHLYIRDKVYRLEGVVVSSVEMNVGETWCKLDLVAQEMSVRKNMSRKT